MGERRREKRYVDGRTVGDTPINRTGIVERRKREMERVGLKRDGRGRE